MFFSWRILIRDGEPQLEGAGTPRLRWGFRKAPLGRILL